MAVLYRDGGIFLYEANQTTYMYLRSAEGTRQVQIAEGSCCHMGEKPRIGAIIRNIEVQGMTVALEGASVSILAFVGCNLAHSDVSQQ